MKNIEKVHQDPIILLGLDFYGDPFSNSSWWSEENEIGQLWHRFYKSFMPVREKFQPYLINNAYYEMHIMNQDYKEKGHYEIFVGIQINDLPEDTLHYLVKKIKAQAFVKVCLSGEEILSDYYPELERQCVDLFGMKLSQEFMIQTYDERFKGMDKINESEMDVFVPLIVL